MRPQRLGVTGFALASLALACGSGRDEKESAAPQEAGVDAGTLDAAAAGAGTVGSSIAVLTSGEVAVVNPDQGSVSFLDASSLAVLATTAVASDGEPHTLLEANVGGKASLLVTSFRTGEVVVVDLATRSVSQRVAVCPGPYGLAASPDASWVAVSCEWDGTVARLDLAKLTVATTPLVTGLRRPRPLAVVGTDLFVADYVGGLVHDVSLATGKADATSLVPPSAPYRPALTAMTANLASALLPAFGDLFVSHVLENNTGNVTGEAEASDYGSVVSTNPKINPAVTTFVAGKPSSAPVVYAQYDGGARVYSGPSALASFGGRYLLVAHLSTANVAVIDTQASTPGTRAVGTFPVGFGPSGIAVDAKGTTAYVDNAVDQSVSKLDLTQPFASPAQRLTASATLVRDLPSPYSLAAQSGRRLFIDATNPHVTPSGVVSCASCHPGGGDDGLVWFIDTPNIPLKRRRTPHLGNATSPTAPFHWNGQYATMSDLTESTLTNLMAGDGLLVDVTTVQAYVDEIVKPPLLPVKDAAAVAHGASLFQSVGCAKCHEGSVLTDDLMHAVLTPMSLTSDDVFPTANTPGLHGMFLMAPYFHDGRAATLEDVLTQPYAAEMDHTTGLSSGDLADLAAYVSSL